jgi:3D (Asp-Asp-Asp) domain-containing protein
MTRVLPLALVLLLVSGCATIKPPRGVTPEARVMTVTGYCKCKTCCNWKRNWHLKPVIATGSSKGVTKKIGVTASGTKAKPGTIAADTTRYPFGTIMYVPGYGYGRVEDRGSAVQGEHIDLFFKTHREALRWGKQTVNVTVWK